MKKNKIARMLSKYRPINRRILARKKSALERACDLLDPAEEVAMAEEGMAEDYKSWPKY